MSNIELPEEIVRLILNKLSLKDIFIFISTSNTIYNLYLDSVNVLFLERYPTFDIAAKDYLWNAVKYRQLIPYIEDDTINDVTSLLPNTFSHYMHECGNDLFLRLIKLRNSPRMIFKLPIVFCPIRD